MGGRQDGTCDVSNSGEIRGVDSYLEFGLRGTFDFGESTQLAGGIRNLTDEEPPFSELAAGGWPWFDQGLYDPRGTTYYVNLTHNFF